MVAGAAAAAPPPDAPPSGDAVDPPAAEGDDTCAAEGAFELPSTQAEQMDYGEVSEDEELDEIRQAGRSIFDELSGAAAAGVETVRIM